MIQLCSFSSPLYIFGNLEIMSFTTLLSTSIPSLPNDVTLITTTINITTSVSGILGLFSLESTELVTSVITSTLALSSVSSSGPTTGFARANLTIVATTTSIATAGTTTTTTTTTITSSSSSILQPLSINTLTETGSWTYLKLSFCIHINYIKLLPISDPPPVTSSFTISPFSNSSIIETFPTSSTEESSSTAITEISQYSYSGQPSQTVSTSVDPSSTSQAAGISFQTAINRSHLLSVLLPTLIVGPFIVCSILWILYYKCKPLSQSRHRLCVTSYPLLIQRTQDNRHKTDSNSCNRDAQGYNLKYMPTNILTDGERPRSPLTTSSHSQFMVEGLRRQNDSSMTLFNTCEC